MKKHNLFLLSYTIFIFICLIVKCFWNYPLWGVIVAAITTASCILSCADITEVVATKYSKDVKDFEPLLDSAVDKCVFYENFYSRHKTSLEQQKDNVIANVLLEGPEVLKDTKKQLVEIQNGLKLKKCVSGICKKVSGPLIVLGYLSFFCTVTFEPINSFLVPIQDYLTVFAFGILMLTQFWGNYVKEEHITLEENYREANRLLDDINKVVRQLSERLTKEESEDAN